MGVDLFFTLSGFLITGILADTVNNSDYYASFIIKRILRIFPLYYFSLILFLLVIPKIDILTNVLNLKFSLAHQEWYWFYASNWLLSLKSGWTHGAGINHFWSLSVEEQFYILWPILIYFFRNRKLLLLCFTTIAISILIRNVLYLNNVSDAALYILSITRADSLALGGAIAILIRSIAGIKLLKNYTLPILVTSSLLLILGVLFTKSVNPYTSFFTTIGYTIVDFICGSIIVLSLSNLMDVNNLFSRPILRFFGKYSYSMYIFHYPIYLIYTSYLNKHNSQPSIGLDILASCLTILSTIILSLATWNLLEKRILALKRNFGKGLEHKNLTR